MTEVAWMTVVLVLGAVGVGLPSALVVRRSQDGAVALGVEALLHGIVWVPLGVTAFAWLRLPGALGVAGLWVATLVLAVRRGARPRVVRPRGRDVLLALAWLAVLAVALLVRLREVRFLPWVGDMGAYVNWANELVATGELLATWPPLFPAWLAVASALFGAAHTTVGLATTGVALVLAVARLVHVMTGRRDVPLVAGAAVALHLHAVWYSSFPSSEALNAPVFVLWVLLVHRIVAEGPGRARTLAVGTVGLALVLLRGSAPLTLVPLAVVVLLTLVVPAWRGLARGVWLAWAATLVGSLVGYWYGISRIPLYFVENQMSSVLPGGAMRLLERLGMLEPGPAAAAGLVVGGALVIGLGHLLVRRYAAPVEDAAPARRAGLVATGAAVVGCVAVLAWQVDAGGELVEILSRTGWALTVAGLVGALLAGASRRAASQVLAVLAVLVVLLYLALHGSRLGGERTHAYYLYWDRYLVSEVLPLLVVLAFVGCAVVLDVFPASLRARPRAVRAVPSVAAVLVASLVVVPGLGALRLATSEVFMRGAFELTSDLARTVEDAGGGVPDRPVVWSASEAAGPPRWFFPNTWMAFAVPLERTFRLEVVGLPPTGSGFLPDPVLDERELRSVLGCADVREAVLLDMRTGGLPADERLAAPGITLQDLGTQTGSLQMLAQPPEDGWYPIAFEVDAWLVRVDGPPVPSRCPDVS